MLDRIIAAYLEKYPERSEQQTYPFIVGMLSTLLNEDNIEGFIQTVKDFS